MRILHVIENVNTGGAEHMLLNLVTEQVRRKHHVEVMCLFELGDLVEHFTAIGVTVTACHKRNGVDVPFIRRVMGVMQAFSPDVVHCHSLMGNYYVAFVRLLTLSRAIQIVTRHGLLREGEVNRLGFLFELSLWLTRWAVGVCDTVSDELLTKHARFTPRILTIKNGINVARFKPRNPDSQHRLKAQLRLAEDYCMVGIVARLNPIKNHRLLLDAFALLNKHNPHSALVIVGDGAIRQELEAYAHTLNIAAVVFFLGDRADVPELLAGLDVFVLSSDNEGYSLALLEAAAASLPLVATDVGGNADIVQPGKNGLIVPSNNSVALAEALMRVLADAEQANAMGEQARAWVEQNGSVQAMANAYERLYKGKR